MRVRSMPADLVAEPEGLPGSSGHGYRVFTPFHRAWREAHIPRGRRRARRGPGDRRGGRGRLPAGDPPLPAGPAAARRHLAASPAMGSMATRTGGAWSPRTPPRGCRRTCASACAPPRRSAGRWACRTLSGPGRPSGARSAGRLYHHHLARNPAVLHAAFEPALRRVLWDDDPGGLAASGAGETGYPLVDAGMRQLAGTWIHNRARMAVASSWPRTCWWTGGAGRRSSCRGSSTAIRRADDGGWQWTAGTGTDAAACFRVSTRSARPAASTRAASTCAATSPSCAASRTTASSSPGP